MSRRYEAFRKKVGSLLFEDSYVAHGAIDDLRAGNQAVIGDPAIDLPVDPAPQAAAQLSQDIPPIEDPEYTPVNKVELAAALSALAKELPDEREMIGTTYDKFRKFVDDNKESGIEVVDSGSDSSLEKIEEARKIIRNFLLIETLNEQSDPREREFDEYRGYSVVEPSDDEVQPTSTPKDQDTLSVIAKEMGVSTSGVKRLEAEALKKMRLFAVHFPRDEGQIKKMAMQYYANGLHDLDLIDKEDVAALISSPESYNLPSFRQFMWDSFLNNVYKKMLRDAEQQGISEEDLGDLQPGLLARAEDYFKRLPDARKMKVLVASMSAAE
jgi:hypothetical protein